MTTNLIRSPGRLFVIWPTSTMLRVRWSRLVLRFPTLQSSFTKSLQIVPSTPVTIGTTITFISLVVWPGLGDLFVSQNLIELCCASHSPGWILLVYILFGSEVKFYFLSQFPVEYLPHSAFLDFMAVQRGLLINGI